MLHLSGFSQLGLAHPGWSPQVVTSGSRLVEVPHFWQTTCLSFTSSFVYFVDWVGRGRQREIWSSELEHWEMGEAEACTPPGKERQHLSCHIRHQVDLGQTCPIFLLKPIVTKSIFKDYTRKLFFSAATMIKNVFQDNSSTLSMTWCTYCVSTQQWIITSLL